MKKIFLVIVVFSALAFGACSTKTAKTAESTNSQTAKEQYTCPMHPEVIQDKPGKCPKCGMDLVKKAEAKADTLKK